MPAISVVLPTYNRARTLPRAIDSVLRQTFGDFELIVVDDASADETESVVRAFSDPRVRYLRLPGNRGAAGARNAGIEAASADWIAFQDSDDEWLDTKLEQQFALARDAPPEVGLILGGYLAQFPERRVEIVPRHTLAGESPIPDLLDGWPIITPTWLARRSLLLELHGFDESWPCFEDWDLVFRLAARCKVRAVRGPLLVKHSDAGSVCSDLQVTCAALQRVLKTYLHHWADDRRRHARRLAQIGSMQYRLGQTRQARGTLRGAVSTDPWTPATLGLYGGSLLGSLAFRVAQRLWPRYARTLP